VTALTAAHPDLEYEQSYVSRAYDLLDRGLADTERSFHDLTTPHRSTARAMRRALEILRNSRGSGQLVFGRFDLNGERMQDGRTSDLIFDPVYLVSYISTFVTLEPGDLILTGTPSGVGFKRTPPRFLVPGSEVVTRIEGIGELRNRCIADNPASIADADASLGPGCGTARPTSAGAA